MKHLIIWKVQDSTFLREVEFLGEVEKSNVDLEELTAYREKWMEFCNAHDVKSLISQVYTPNTMYYNRGRLLQGTEALITEYDYMTNPKYTLSLSPLLIEPVADDLVYEIGQCAGSYNGKYILVWQKNQDNVWQVLFDSNY